MSGSEDGTVDPLSSNLFPNSRESLKSLFREGGSGAERREGLPGVGPGRTPLPPP